MFKIIKSKLATKDFRKYESIKYFATELADSIVAFDFEFQQGTVDDMADRIGKRLPTEAMMDLSSVVCAGTCYWSALTILGLETRTLNEFIDEIYSPENKIKHTLGIDHIQLIKHIGDGLNGRFYGLALNPFRDQNFKSFRDYGGFFGDESLQLFKKSFLDIGKTSDAAKKILAGGGLAVVSIQAGFNGYSPNFHDVLVLGSAPGEGGEDNYLIFDPDARVFYDTQKQRPEEVKPLKGTKGLYVVSSDYMDKNTYREKPSPGGITIGLFSVKR